VPVLATGIPHLPNNYADDPRSPLGKVRVDMMFVGAGSIGRFYPARPGPLRHPPANIVAHDLSLALGAAMGGDFRCGFPAAAAPGLARKPVSI